MDKLGWVLLPIVLGAAVVAALALRGQMPSRQTLNVASSLLLLGYVAATAGLGVFWVANQHLPVFDWHYLFGYALVGLVVVHLAFNLRVVVQHLRRRPPKAAPVRGRRPLVGWLGLAGAAAAGGLGLFVGWRQGRSELRVVPVAVPASAGAGAAAVDEAFALVEKFHALSSHSRTGAIARAPSVAWGEGPPPFKPVVASQVLALPPPALRPRPGEAPRIDVAALGVLLWHSAGVSAVRGGLHLRTSPSSGALFATELYLVARRVDGLEPGVWHYAPQRHALARLRGGEFDDVSVGLPAQAAEADALVVATALFRRSGRKYGDRTYRYVLADLGHALENLRVAAAEVGLHAGIEPRFDGGRAAAVLGVDEAEEGVLAVVRFDAGGAATQAAAGGEPPLPGRQRTVAAAPGRTSNEARRGAVAAEASGWTPPPLVGATSAALGITDAVHRATALRLEGAAPRREVSAPPAAPSASPGVLLPEAVAAGADRLDVIARRRSQRRHAATALAQQDLAAVLGAMSAPPPQLSAAVRIHVLTPAVRGLPQRAWRWDAAANVLRPATDPDAGLRRRARSAALDQDVVGDAAAVFVLTIDREALAADPAGPARGYRHAFIEAGMVGERVYLEAGARGLAVCAVGAFYDDEAARLIAIDPAREWPVHFVALGVPG